MVFEPDIKCERKWWCRRAVRAFLSGMFRARFRLFFVVAQSAFFSVIPRWPCAFLPPPPPLPSNLSGRRAFPFVRRGARGGGGRSQACRSNSRAARTSRLVGWTGTHAWSELGCVVPTEDERLPRPAAPLPQDLRAEARRAKSFSGRTASAGRLVRSHWGVYDWPEGGLKAGGLKAGRGIPGLSLPCGIPDESSRWRARFP